MLRVGKEIRFRLAAILVAHWSAFVAQHRKWIRPVIFETVRKITVCRTPALGCHIYQCPNCHKIEIVPHSCKSRFCPSCGKLATDRWADGVLNDLLDVPYHHLVMSAPWQLRPIIAFNRQVGLNLLARAATGARTQWARDQHDMRIGHRQRDPYLRVRHQVGIRMSICSSPREVCRWTVSTGYVHTSRAG
jgi:hypothetical protein